MLHLPTSTLFPYTTLFRSTVTVSGAYADVNTVLASLNYTATSEFEGSDTLHVTATSTDGAALPSAASADQSVAITVNPFSDTPSVCVPVTATVLDENTAQAISGVGVTPATGDESDPVAATLTVAHGTLHLAGLAGVTVTANDSGTVTVSGAYADVDTVLPSPFPTRRSSVLGSDTLHVTATSTDGAALPSAASAD